MPHISGRPVTLVSKNSSLSLESSLRVHFRFDVQEWGRKGWLNCSANPIVCGRELSDAGGMCEEVRGVETSGWGAVAEVMARDEESA